MNMKELKVMMSFLLLSLGCLTISAQQEVLTKEFRGERSKAGEATIWQSQRYAKDGLGCTSFEVDIPSSGNYFVNFWMIPTQEPSGEPSNYTVEVNGKTIADKIIPTKCDWQSVGISSKKPFHLNAGRNTIAVLGKLPFLPEVETIRLSSSIDNAVISSEKYDEFKNKILSGATDLQTVSSSSSRSSSFPIYGLWQLGASISYTFTTTLYLNAGTLYNISSSSNSSYAHYLEVFNEPNQNNSYRVLSSGGQATISNIQSSTGGIYVVRVRSSHHGTTSTATVSVNGGLQYTNVPITNYEISYSQPTDNEYNSFLCYKSGNGDPYLDLMSYSSNKVYLARNDDGSSYSGDFSWGDCPRIKTQLNISSDAALVFTNSSLYPSCTADIYLGFPNLSDVNSIILDSFPNLKNGDAIVSAPVPVYPHSYNCIAWTVGDYNHNIWVDGWAPFYEPTYADEEEWFDDFYETFGYTRTGATASNSIIDLWAKDNHHTHASIRKSYNSDAFPHGYAWESKLGSDVRIFHPRYALSGTGSSQYGSVVAYYIHGNRTYNSLYEGVAEGQIIIEGVSFTSEEKQQIDNIINSINKDIAQKFTTKFTRWKEALKQRPYNSLYQLKNYEEYLDLYYYCLNHKDVIYIAYKILGEGDQVVQFLIKDVTFKDHLQLMKDIQNENKKNKKKAGGYIFRSTYTNSMKYVKKIIATENNMIDQPLKRSATRDSGISYSDKNAFLASVKDKTVNVDFALKENAWLSIAVYTLEGVVVNQPMNNQQLSSGNHHVSMLINKSGTYLIVFVENGTTSVKKVIIN